MPQTTDRRPQDGGSLHMKGILFGSTAHAPRRTRRRLRRAWKAVADRQELDERRYTEAVLGLNNLRVLFRPDRDDWDIALGRKCKDLLYGFWWEEDLRLRLAAELLKFNDCQVHGQVHIRTKVRKKARKHIHQSRKSRYPDLLLIATKEREITRRSNERNLETAATELKYFGMGQRPSDIERAIRKDLRKLLGYCRPRSSPRTDAGYFFCIDETGQDRAPSGVDDAATLSLPHPRRQLLFRPDENDPVPGAGDRRTVEHAKASQLGARARAAAQWRG